MLLKNAGGDETENFERAAHPKQAYKWMKDFYVGKLAKKPNAYVCGSESNYLQT